MKHLLLAVSLVLAAPLNRIIAVVDDQVILESELDEVTAYAFQSQNKAVPQGKEYQATRRTVLKSMIEDKLLVKYAELESVTVSDDEVAAQREQQIDMFIKQVGSREALEAELQSKHGLTLSKLKKSLDDQIREQFLKGRLTEKLKFMYAPTRKEIERFYRDYRDSLPRQRSSVHIAHIMRKIEPSAAVVDSARKKIKAAAGRLLSGEGFAALAEAYSEDTVSAKNGGDLGFIEKGFLDKIINRGELSPEMLDAIVAKLDPFYQQAAGGEAIKEFGRAQSVSVNVLENFEQTESFIGCEALSQKQFDSISAYARDFLSREELFNQRINADKIRDCHGDLYSANICLADQVYIFDCIEFNERFRYCDVASDAAFLAMDLDFHNLSDLSEHFINKLTAASGDETLRGMLNFYKCYRAYVRGKIGLFTAHDPQVDEATKKSCLAQASRYFQLAAQYAQQ